LAVTGGFHLAYVSALVESLRRGLPPLEPLEAVVSTTARAMTHGGHDEAGPPYPPTGPPASPLVRPLGTGEAALGPAAALGSSDTAQVRAALAHGLGDAVAVAAALPLLGRDDLFADVIAALRKVAARFTGQLVDALLDPA